MTAPAISLAKREPYRNEKILKAANGQPCMIMSPVCTGGGRDTVACHSNLGEDGKGMRTRADDCFVAFGCQACHDFIDGRQWNTQKDYRQWPHTLRQEYFQKGMKRTWRALLDLGVLK